MKRISVLLLLGSVSGCGAIPTLQANGFTLQQDTFKTDEDEIRRRASFELSCAREKLELTVLSVTYPGSSWARQIGVAGCEHRLVYVRQDTGTGTSTWVLNSQSTRPQN